MERSRAVLLLALLGVWFSRTSGRLVEMRVRPGENTTFYSDCGQKTGFKLVWVGKSLHEDQPPLIMSVEELRSNGFPRYSIVWNQSKLTYDLLVKNISESDLGLSYCALQKRKTIKNTSGDRVPEHVYQDGNRSIFLSFLDSVVPCTEPPQTTSTSTPPVSDCSICWKLLVSVCPVCVLLSSLISSTCVYFICRFSNNAVRRAEQRENVKMRNRNEAGDENICYASLDLPKSGQKHLKNKEKKKKIRVESSEFSTYSQVKTDRM